MGGSGKKLKTTKQHGDREKKKARDRNLQYGKAINKKV